MSVEMVGEENELTIDNGFGEWGGIAEHVNNSASAR